MLSRAQKNIIVATKTPVKVRRENDVDVDDDRFSMTFLFAFIVVDSLSRDVVAFR